MCKENVFLLCLVCFSFKKVFFYFYEFTPSLLYKNKIIILLKNIKSTQVTFLAEEVNYVQKWMMLSVLNLTAKVCLKFAALLEANSNLVALNRCIWYSELNCAVTFVYFFIYTIYSNAQVDAFLLSGVILKQSNRVLTIQRVKKEDSGLYICTACNQQGCESSEARISVDGECVVKKYFLI